MKKARLNPEEIERLSSDAWTNVLKSEHERKTTISAGSTIRIDNCEQHFKFSASQLEWKREVVDSDEESTHSEEVEDIPKPSVLMKPSEFYSLHVDRTEEQCLKELSAPQRSDEWLSARKYCITASQFGSAAGESPYQTSEALIVDKLWNTFQGNAATDWGTFHEPHAKESFLKWLDSFMPAYTFREENLMKFSSQPWMAVSPDGLIEYEEAGHKRLDLVEFKCPAFLRNTAEHPYAKWGMTIKGRILKNVPPHYMAQIQGIMGYLNTHQSIKIGRCWFVVWQPHQTWITLVDYDEEYYDKLHDKVKSWYFKELLPAFTHQANGLINYGETKPCEPIIVEKIL